MNDEQKIKAMLVLLAEYLQTTLTDAQVTLYARDLGDLGPEVVATAIKRLQADPSVWAGRFPLPAKLRSYLTGTVEDRATASAWRILNDGSLSELEQAVAAGYGNKTIWERNPSNTPTIFAQLRSLCAAAYSKQQREGRLSLGQDNKNSLGETGIANHLLQERADEMRVLHDPDELREDPSSPA